MVRKWTEGGEARPLGARGKMVAEIQRECYHNSTVPVKEYLEVVSNLVKNVPFLNSIKMSPRWDGKGLVLGALERSR